MPLTEGHRGAEPAPATVAGARILIIRKDRRRKRETAQRGIGKDDGTKWVGNPTDCLYDDYKDKPGTKYSRKRIINLAEQECLVN